MRFYYCVRPQTVYDEVARQYYQILTLNKAPRGPLAACVKPIAITRNQGTERVYAIYTDASKLYLSTLAHLQHFLLEHHYRMLQPYIWAYEQKM